MIVISSLRSATLIPPRAKAQSFTQKGVSQKSAKATTKARKPAESHRGKGQRRPNIKKTRKQRRNRNANKRKLRRRRPPHQSVQVDL